ncbi:Arginine-tRNA-protein transferase [Paramagnetospirillum magnetotacticum MS-1]|uniref:Aspartate/glutamate leucyltransferase n=1 Tax=Paramagnetospirillum magnetotacticum MS-1 TaxID=272627 RepID=A0A0C2YWE0_PARME|nr:arginyltransferase [Paramagnetospirillum magnetotacticum]KIL99020.1 Arginine-tRNA-protein transferase [Paramagnetospirillum magnetotacticum MS-1]
MDHFPLKRPHFFFTTAPLPCPYVSGRLERKIVTELNGTDADCLHEALSRAGFRRSHSIAYTPACPGCNACIPVRIVADEFTPDRTMRRIWRTNGALIARKVPARASADQFRLFARYQESRHSGGDMALMGFYDYRSMVEDSPIDTFIVEFRDGEDNLVAACLADGMGDGLSAVYSFFDPDLASRSLGTFMVLWLVEEARRQSLPYVYLGYWIEESRKMSYKTRYQPLEAFGPDGWKRFAADGDT